MYFNLVTGILNEVSATEEKDITSSVETIRKMLGLRSNTVAIIGEYIISTISGNYHYLGVFPYGQGQFIAADAYGKLGQAPQVKEVTRGTQEQAIAACSQRLKEEEGRGYRFRVITKNGKVTNDKSISTTNPSNPQDNTPEVMKNSLARGVASSLLGPIGGVVQKAFGWK